MNDVTTAHVGSDPKVFTHAPLDTIPCRNPKCDDYGKLGGDNIKLYVRYGRKQVRLLICKTCGKTFSELNGTPLYDSRLSFEQIGRIVRGLIRGEAIRAIAKAENVSKNTPKRYIRVALKDPVALWRQIEPFVGEVNRREYDEYLSRVAHGIVVAKEQPVPPRQSIVAAANAYLAKKKHAPACA